MAAIQVKPVGHRVHSGSPIRNKSSKGARKNLFGSPNPGETDRLYQEEQEKNIQRLSNYVLQTTNSQCRVNSIGASEELIKNNKRSASPLMTDHFKKIKKVFPPRPLLTTTKENLSDVEQCTPDACKIGSTHFVTNSTTLDSSVETDAIRTGEPSSPTPHQQNQNQEQSTENVTSHIKVANHAGKFS